MSDQNQDDVYADIFVSGSSLDRELLARTVAPHIRIFTDNNVVEIVFTSAEKLTNRQKLLIYLLARKILNDKQLLAEDEKEGLTPSELEEATNISGGSIRPVLANLLKERLVQKEESHYYVPNYSLAQVSKEFQEE